MPLSDHVTLSITQDSVGVARAGFGTPLILSATAAFAERVRTYSSLAEVATDFASTTGPEYRAAAAIFAQNPKVQKIKIGRSALQPTQRYTISVTTVRNSYTYSIAYAGDGVTPGTATYASDASATDGEIVAGLVAALNLAVGKNFTAAGATSPFTVTGDAAGEWFSLAVDPADLDSAQNHADPGVATDLAAIVLEDDDWYALYTMYNSKAYVGAAAAWIETQKKIYVVDVVDTDAVTVAVASSDDTLEDLFDLAYARTMGAYHPVPAEMMGAAWLGKCLPIDPGGETWKFKTLAGVSPSSLTSTHKTNLRARKANWYETVAGVNITMEGTTADGDFLDVQRGLDWLEDDMSKGVFEALAGSNKIPFTDAGVAVIEAKVRRSLKRAVSRQILASDPAPTVTVPKVADVSSADKAARLLPDVKFTGTLTGAIHKVEISGVVSV